MFYCASTDSADSCPKAEGYHLIYLCKQVTEAKSRSNPYMVIFNFTGYFILVLCDFPLPGACDLPHVQISQVLSLCYAIPTSLLLSQDSGLLCLFLILLPATSQQSGFLPSPSSDIGEKN
jgi:hypothetical protein